MLSKNKIKQIQSLNRKKVREECGLFLVEGNKMVEEAVNSKLEVETIVCTQEFADENRAMENRVSELIVTDKDSILKASLLQNPQEAIAIVKKPNNVTPELKPEKELYLGLDFIQDPGNLGTILRIADWFGVKSVICSDNTVDVYNPKVVQASMGAIFRVNCIYADLEQILAQFGQSGTPVYGTFMNGESIYSTELSANGIIVMGNEGNGISDSIEKLVTRRLTIPNFSAQENKSESLNVAIATAICCSEFKRRLRNG
jgi:TrmH family RNA methyltransferase